MREGEQTFHVNSISLAADAKQVNEVPLVVVKHLQERSIDLKEIMVDAFKRELRQDTTVDEFIDFLRLLLLEGFLFLKVSYFQPLKSGQSPYILSIFSLSSLLRASSNYCFLIAMLPMLILIHFSLNFLQLEYLITNGEGIWAPGPFT